jgi:hypothetical protein
VLSEKDTLLEKHVEDCENNKNTVRLRWSTETLEAIKKRFLLVQIWRSNGVRKTWKVFRRLLALLNLYRFGISARLEEIVW